MKKSVVSMQSWLIGHYMPHLVLWVLALALTLGLSGLAWKRPVSPAQIIAVDQAPIVAVHTQRRSAGVAIVGVREIRRLPIWALGYHEVDLMVEDLPRVVSV